MEELMTLEDIKKECPRVDVANEAFVPIIKEFKSIKTKDQKDDLINQVKDYSLLEDNVTADNRTLKHVWALFGKIDKDTWICIEVGSSKDIKSEICSNLDSMYVTEVSNTYKYSFFHTNKSIYNALSYADKVSCKYRHINHLFNNFKWVEIDVNKYLEKIDTKDYDRDSYAEVKCAVDYRALMWNPAPRTDEWDVLRDEYSVEYRRD